MYDTTKKLHLESFADGAAQELFEDELQRVLQDLVDPNAEHKAKRKLTLSFTFTPGKERGSPVGVDIKASSKLAPRNSAGTAINVGRVGSTAVCAEYDPRQLDLQFEQQHKPRRVDDDAPNPETAPRAEEEKSA